MQNPVMLSKFLALAYLALGLSVQAQVKVILWFDTEDFLLPASDDSAKRLAELLRERGIRATFKVVGEKARTLEKRGRKDVIAALKAHDIGYHSDFHSVHPTPAEYLAEAGFLDGVAEFARREGDGADDVRRIFGVQTLSCYGQPGSSWVPQAFAALPLIHVAPSGRPCYVDEGSHIGLNGQPFYYQSVLTVYKMGPNVIRVDLHKPEDLEPARKKVADAATRLNQAGGGLISIFYHPCEWVHAEFWDGVNFRRGANPPKDQWRAPAQLPAEKTEAAFKQFAAWIDYIRKIVGVEFVTASDLPKIYPDSLKTSGYDSAELLQLVAKVSESADLDIVQLRNTWSVADQFEAITRAASALLSGAKPADLKGGKLAGLLGPESTHSAKEITVSRADMVRPLEDVLDFCKREKRVPSQVFIGPDAVAPGDFLKAVAKMCAAALNGGRIPEQIYIANGAKLIPANYVAADTPKLYGDWIIHREGFQAPKLLEIARLQTWTLKPAVLKR